MRFILIIFLFLSTISKGQTRYLLLIVDNTPYVSINGKLFMIDTGSTITIIHSDDPSREDVNIIGINGKSRGMILTDSYLLGYKVDLVFTDLTKMIKKKNIPIYGILGSDFLIMYNAVINYRENFIRI